MNLTPEQEAVILSLLTNAYENPMYDEDSDCIEKLIDLFQESAYNSGVNCICGEGHRFASCKAH